MNGITSQRGITTILIAIVFVAGSIYAYTAGNHFSNGTDLLISMGVLAAAVTGWFSILDTHIANGDVEPGDFGALLVMPSWWLLMFASLATVTQITGFKFFDPAQQDLLVSSITGLIGLLFHSFGNRTPQSLGTVQALAELEMANELMIFDADELQEMVNAAVAKALANRS